MLFMLQVLLNALEKCFYHVKENKLKSIAFPTLGCGNLQYPVQKVIDYFRKVAEHHPDIQVHEC